MVRAINPTERLINELFQEAEQIRCPHIRRDDISPYCAKDLSSKKILEERRIICDHVSLQFWCLHSTDYQKCIYYQGEKIE